MNNNVQSILIIDGLSTAACYAPIFRAYGITCVHIFSSPDIARYFGGLLNSSDYEVCFIHEGDIEKTQEKLSRWAFSAILHGFDSALELVDLLSQFMQLLRTNDCELTIARKNKFEMVEVVRRNGLLVPEQRVSDNIETLCEWAEKHSQYPVIIKPVEGAGVKGVFKCNSQYDVRNAFDEVMSTASYYEVPNEVVLIQSYSIGQEYIIDSVSLDGEHYLTSIWAVFRDKEGSPFLDYMETVDHELPEYDVIKKYTGDVINALGVRNGPTHLEIILTERGPTIVELNCRMHGSLDPRLLTYVCGRNQVQDVVASILSPDYFRETRVASSRCYGKAMHVLLRSAQAGRMIREDYWLMLQNLPSFVSVRKHLPDNSLTQETRDLTTALGTLSLFHHNPEQLERDIIKVRNAEQSGSMYK